MGGYKDLEVWRLAHHLRLAIYRETGRYPADERYSLVDQTRRAACSIASNIAEGSGRGTNRDFTRFLSYAMGSANETEDQLLLARDLGYIEESSWRSLSADLTRVKAMLARLRIAMKATRTSPQSPNE